MHTHEIGVFKIKKKEVEIVLPEGKFNAVIQEFEETDRDILFNIYNEWRSLSNTLKSLASNARAVNTPELLSEGIFSLTMGVVRKEEVKGTKNLKPKTSFDCFDLRTNERIQVKATAVEKDVTSFGPKSVWDKLYFVDFYRKGNWDGTFDIYLIDNDDIYNHKVNAKQTLKEQQLEGKRPRLSIKSIIKMKDLKPLKSGSLKLKEDFMDLNRKKSKNQMIQENK